MAIIVDGNEIAEQILAGLKDKLEKLNMAGVTPHLAVILVGQDPVSLSYIKIKQQKAEEIGLKVEVKAYPENISQSDLQKATQELNGKPEISGILVQLPLPSHLDRQAILDAVSMERDVDCLNSVNRQKLIAGEKVKFLPPAPAAVLKILEFYQIDLAKANILVVGSGELVGQPLAAILLNRKINFRLANRYTENLVELTKEADIIITGAGKSGLISGGMIKDGAVVIDAGATGSESGDVVGDVDIESVSKKATLLAPVPGGVGPVTVAMLLQNVILAAFDSAKWA